jgi:hypothetical protein
MPLVTDTILNSQGQIQKVNWSDDDNSRNDDDDDDDNNNNSVTSVLSYRIFSIK